MRPESDLDIRTPILRPKPGRWILAATAILATLGNASVAWAEEMTAPPDAEKAIWQWSCMIVFVVLCCVVAFKNPKRSHMS